MESGGLFQGGIPVIKLSPGGTPVSLANCNLRDALITANPQLVTTPRNRFIKDQDNVYAYACDRVFGAPLLWCH